VYILLPLFFILGSALGISVILWRKGQYIKKLATAEGAVLNGNGISKKEYLFKLFSEFSPELVGAFKSIKLQEYKDAWLVEVEKFLRRLRLVSLRMDRWSNSWIQGIRRHVDQSASNNTQAQSSVQEPVEEKKQIKAEEKIDQAEEFRREEQRLIIEIARNPKDSKLYGALGELYIKMGEYGDAKESFEAAIELDPSNEEFKQKLSFSLEKIASSEASQK